MPIDTGTSWVNHFSSATHFGNNLDARAGDLAPGFYDVAEKVLRVASLGTDDPGTYEARFHTPGAEDRIDQAIDWAHHNGLLSDDQRPACANLGTDHAGGRPNPSAHARTPQEQWLNGTSP